jgi:hypothetical protein
MICRGEEDKGRHRDIPCNEGEGFGGSGRHDEGGGEDGWVV